MVDVPTADGVDPGVVPMGYSYAEGQARLHRDGDPGGDYLAAYKDTTYLTAMFGGFGGIVDPGAGYSNIIAQLAGQGPIPQDVETTQVHSDLWDPKDAVDRERHIYFYDTISFEMTNTGKFLRPPGPHAADLKLRLQIVGHSQNRKRWVLPQKFNTPVASWNLVDGTTLAQGQWTHTTSLTDWGNVPGNYRDYVAVISTIQAVIGSMVGAGGLAGAVQKAALALMQMLPAISNAVTTGNSSGLLASFEGIVVGLVGAVLTDPSVAERLKSAVAGVAGAGGLGGTLISYAETTGKTVANIIGQADNTLSGVMGSAGSYVNTLIGEGLHGMGNLPAMDVLARIASVRELTPRDLLALALPGHQGDLASFQAQLEDLCGGAAVDAARATLGGTGSLLFTNGVIPMGQATGMNAPLYFFDLAAAAENPGHILDLADGIPGYATEYFLMGATLRSAQLAKDTSAWLAGAGYGTQAALPKYDPLNPGAHAILQAPTALEAASQTQASISNPPPVLTAAKKALLGGTSTSTTTVFVAAAALALAWKLGLFSAAR